MVETIVALFVVSICMVMLTSICKGLTQISKDTRLNDDALGIYQLRLLLAQADNITLEHNQLQFVYHKKTYTISFHNHRIVKKDGYEIFLESLDSAEVFMEEGCYSVSWTRNKKTTQAILWCE